MNKINSIFLFLFLGFCTQLSAQSITKAKTLYQIKHYEEAIKEFEAILENNPEDTTAAFHLGRVLIEVEKYDDAIANFKKLARKHPKVVRFNYWCGVAYRHKLMTTENYMERGILSSKMKQYFEKTVELDSKHIEAHISIASYYMNAPTIAGGSKTKALTIAKKIETLDKEEALLLQSNIHAKFEDYQAAIQANEALLKVTIKEEHPKIYMRIVLFYQSLKNYNEAFQYCEKAIAMDETYYYAHYQYARTAAFSKTKVDEGIEKLNFYIKNQDNLRPSNPKITFAYWRLGMLYELKKDKVTAKKHYEKAVELDEGNKQAKEALQALD